MSTHVESFLVNTTGPKLGCYGDWRSPVFRRIASLAVLLIIAFLIWAIAFPHESSTSGPVSLDQAKECPIPLPGSARNIQFYKWHQWNLFVQFVRFEALPQDCLDHVDTVLDDWRKEFDVPIYSAEPLTVIEHPPMRVHFAEQFDVTWFDPHNIQEGMSAGGGGSGVPMIWVDTRRGVFYYRLTD